MGPRTLVRGNFTMASRCSLCKLCFNGAAHSRARKCGTIQGIHVALFCALQWGRALSCAEMQTQSSLPARTDLLQWGRALSCAEMTTTAALHTFVQVTLQWGRALSCAEI